MIARDMWHDYMQRRGARTQDSIMAFQEAALLDMMVRLEIILADESVPYETITRVLRSLLYGAPSEADAMMREQQNRALYEAFTRNVPSFLPSLGDLVRGAPENPV